MEQRSSTKDAAARDVQTLLWRVECALDMEQRSNDATSKDVQTFLREEVCAWSMVRRSSGAVVKGAKTKLWKEECALGMEQNIRDAEHRGVQTKASVEDCVGGMGHTATQTKKTDDCRKSKSTQSVLTTYQHCLVNNAFEKPSAALSIWRAFSLFQWHLDRGGEAVDLSCSLW